MENNVLANWNIRQIVYNVDDPNELMADKEHTWYFHDIQSMDRHTKQQMKPKLHEQHKTSCCEYKNATFVKKRLMIDMQPFNVGGIP
jgi:hypothetical protein